MILPTDKDGADRAYPVDDLVLSLTGPEIMTLIRCTGVTPDFLIAQAIRGAAKDAPAPAEDVDLMRLHLSYAWIARYRAGERTESGEPMTLDEATAFPFLKIRYEMEPGDLPSETPHKPSSRGGRATGGGKRSRSANTDPRT